MAFTCIQALAFFMLERLFQSTVSSNIMARLPSMTKKSVLVVVPTMVGGGGGGGGMVAGGDSHALWLSRST